MKHLLPALLATTLLLPGFSYAQSNQAADSATPAWDAALNAAISQRSDDQRARDEYRHPAATLAFFQVEPGMTVAEVLPGGGWYTRILANYLGADGTLYGVNYADDMWPLLSYATEEWIAQRIAATAAFPEQVAGFTDNGIQAAGFTFKTVPEAAEGEVDRVLLIRALHNLSRFEAQAGTLTQATQAIHKMLKDDGLVGVVQHRAPESVSDASAAGERGYLKQSAVVEQFEKAGFELVASSEINANAADQPGEEGIVWRLPPSLRGSEDNADLKEAMLAIGESDRMTLLFRKAPK